MRRIWSLEESYDVFDFDIRIVEMDIEEKERCLEPNFLFGSGRIKISFWLFDCDDPGKEKRLHNLEREIHGLADYDETVDATVGSINTDGSLPFFTLKYNSIESLKIVRFGRLSEELIDEIGNDFVLKIRKDISLDEVVIFDAGNRQRREIENAIKKVSYEEFFK